MTERRVVVMARHGESEWSKNNIFCGWYDSPLSDRGTYFTSLSVNLVYFDSWNE